METKTSQLKVELKAITTERSPPPKHYSVPSVEYKNLNTIISTFRKCYMLSQEKEINTKEWLPFD